MVAGFDYVADFPSDARVRGTVGCDCRHSSSTRAQCMYCEAPPGGVGSIECLQSPVFRIRLRFERRVGEDRSDSGVPLIALILPEAALAATDATQTGYHVYADDVFRVLIA
jgi:hypothetical protein